MRKIRFTLGIILIMVFGLSTVVYAEEETPTVTFDGSAVIKYNYDDTANFGTKFQDMQPGETREQEIILKNEYSRTVDFFMKAEVIQAFEDLEKGSGAAYQVKMTVTQGNNVETIYGGMGEDNSARIGGDTVGLKDMNGNLTEWFKVATLAQNEQAVVTLSVYLDGETHSNDYQAVNGTFQFEFQASYDDPETITRTVQEPDKVERRETTRRSGITSVKTGDTAEFFPYIIGIVLAMLMMVIVRKRKKQEEQ